MPCLVGVRRRRSVLGNNADKSPPTPPPARMGGGSKDNKEQMFCHDTTNPSCFERNDGKYDLCSLPRINLGLAFLGDMRALACGAHPSAAFFIEERGWSLYEDDAGCMSLAMQTPSKWARSGDTLTLVLGAKCQDIGEIVPVQGWHYSQQVVGARWPYHHDVLLLGPWTSCWIRSVGRLDWLLAGWSIGALLIDISAAVVWGQ